MSVVAIASRKKSWQTGRHRVSVEAALAIQRENVMQRLVRLRQEVGHPDKPGEPLPQDQAAQRAGVTARQWQRWESGASVPYARNLSAVADAYGFDVGEFYDGPAGQLPAATPSPFPAVDSDERLARLETMLSRGIAEQDRMGELIEHQNALLARQSKILEGIENLLNLQLSAARQMEAAAAEMRAETERRQSPRSTSRRSGRTAN